MKYILTVIFIFLFSFAAYGQNQPFCSYGVTFDPPVVPAAGGPLNYTIAISDGSVPNCANFSFAERPDIYKNGIVQPNYEPARTWFMDCYSSVTDTHRHYDITQESGCTIRQT